MNPLILAGIVDAIGKIADDLFTSDKERLDAQIELQKVSIEAAKIDASLATGQMEVNKAEATNTSLFVAGWRPAIGWVGAASMLYQFLIYPFLVWGWALMQAKGWVPVTMSAPPMLEAESLWVILSGMLGIASLRTVEKVKSAGASKG
ncbi:holin family protein [Delftia deserti]|uniref:Holin family protein n=1 Tax=Delftia deserti TaxID=1651218 RepID=A0ABW5EQU5_9BURK